MIAIRRGAEPLYLITNGSRLTQQLLEAIDKGDLIEKRKIESRYRHQNVKEAVVRDARGKCAYCESRMLHVAFGDIEHIRPKAHFPESTFAWENMLLSCSQCNSSKSDAFDEHNPPINPYSDDPDVHLFAWGYTLWARPGSDRGKVTIELLDLNRAGLVEARRERGERLGPLLDAWHRSSGRLKEMAHRQLMNEIANDKEYVMVVKSLFEQLRVPLVLVGI